MLPELRPWGCLLPALGGAGGCLVPVLGGGGHPPSDLRSTRKERRMLLPLQAQWLSLPEGKCVLPRYWAHPCLEVWSQTQL